MRLECSHDDSTKRRGGGYDLGLGGSIIVSRSDDGAIGGCDMRFEGNYDGSTRRRGGDCDPGLDGNGVVGRSDGYNLEFRWQ
ncbi:hypothetical protein BHM03_00019752 [Ensete ventricosum]|uniref:Uncharacterized protein n=1 Tax=Ensete ventricosum TaxID=4639 RepID=A0A445MFP3_ENSVE|nr:hypothetical protein BHM03_00019752 [Ensete ventricosum]